VPLFLPDEAFVSHITRLKVFSSFVGGGLVLYTVLKGVRQDGAG
jgi:hypothetical protein